MQERCALICLLLLLSGCDDSRPLADIESALRKSVERSAAQIELRKYGVDGLKVWLKLLGERQDFTLFTAAVSELGEYGDAARQAIPVLIEYLRDGFPGLQSPTDQSVVDRFEHPDAVRKQAGEALARFGAAVVPQLQKLLAHENVRVRQEVALTLGRIGKAAAAAVPAILGRLADPDAAVAASAAWALGRIEHVDATVLAAAKTALQHAHHLVRFETLKALRAFGGRAEALRADVEALLEDADSNVRTAAGQVLAVFPPAKRPAKEPAKKPTETPARKPTDRSAGAGKKKSPGKAPR